MIRLRVIEGPNTRDQIVLCAFHSFLVEVQMNSLLHTCTVHAIKACIITTWAGLFEAELR